MGNLTARFGKSSFKSNWGYCSICTALLLPSVLACGLVDNSHNLSAADSSGGTGAWSAGTGGRNAGGETFETFVTILDGGVPEMPADPRPEAPNRNIPIAMGSIGWQQSSLTYCDTHLGNLPAYFIWADARGVFASVTSGCVTTVSGGSNCSAAGSFGVGLQFNDGKGWRSLYQSSDYKWAQIAGFPPNGPLVLTGFSPISGDAMADATSITFFGGSSVESLQSGNVRLLTQSLAAVEPKAIGVYGFTGLGPNHAYVWTQNEGSTSSLLEYLNGQWSSVAALATTPNAVWGDTARNVAAGVNQIFIRTGNSAQFVELSGTPVGIYSGLWGFGSNEIWAGTSAGQLVHYDGKGWQTVPTGAVSDIRKLWGADGILYFITSAEFGRYDTAANDAGASAEILIHADAGLSFYDIAGRSRNEVFLAVSDISFTSFRCGDEFLVWFDGTTFHQF